MLTEQIQDIQPRKYKNFSCGIPELDVYLHRYAKNNHKRGIGKTFAMLQDDIVMGYYTISMGNIEFLEIPEALRYGLPKYPIPVARIGRLAVDVKYQGNGYGGMILLDALERIWLASQNIAAFGVVVDAKDNEAKNFYKHYNFVPYFNEGLSLLLPINTLDTLFSNVLISTEVN